MGIERLSAAEVISLLGLEPHPEGGHYRETFRDPDGHGGRNHSTAILYLLAEGQRSHWHRVVDAAELWHFYAGAPLALAVSDSGAGVTELTLGLDLAVGERPQAVVPKLSWQSARSLGDWSLVGCTVAPGFAFESLEMAPPGWNPGDS
jgi:predicted cupin superfamily sugar epimerase